LFLDTTNWEKFAIAPYVLGVRYEHTISETPE